MTIPTDLIQRLFDVATCRIKHHYNGQCPDAVEGPNVRDEDCPACQVLIEFGRLMGVSEERSGGNTGSQKEKVHQTPGAHHFDPYWSLVGNAVANRRKGNGLALHSRFKVPVYVVELCEELLKEVHNQGNHRIFLEDLIKLEYTCTGADYQHKLSMRCYRLAQQVSA